LKRIIALLLLLLLTNQSYTRVTDWQKIHVRMLMSALRTTHKAFFHQILAAHKW